MLAEYSPPSLRLANMFQPSKAISLSLRPADATSDAARSLSPPSPKATGWRDEEWRTAALGAAPGWRMGGGTRFCQGDIV